LVDPTSLTPIRRIRSRAIGGFRAMLADVFASAGSATFVRAISEELARFAICFCDGCFVSHQVEPEATNLRRLLDNLRIGLLGIARTRLAEDAASRGRRSPRRAPKGPAKAARRRR
jgi:hypothetical protein